MTQVVLFGVLLALVLALMILPLSAAVRANGELLPPLLPELGTRVRVVGDW